MTSQREMERRATRVFQRKQLPQPRPPTGAAPLSGHTNAVTRVVALDDGALLATSCYDGRVRVYESAGGASVPRCELEGVNGLALALSPLGGSVLAAAGWSDIVVTWDARSGAKLDVLHVPDRLLPSLAKIDDSTFVAGTSTGDLVFFQHSNGRGVKETARIAEAHTGWINHIEVRGDLMVTASFDKSATLWHIPSRKCVTTLPHTSNVWCAALGESYLVTGAQGEMRVYELERECALKLVLKGVHANQFIHAVALASDDWLMSAGGDGTVCFTSLTSEQPMVRVSTSVPYVMDIALLPNGRVAVCGNESNDCYSKIFPSPNDVESPLREYTATLFPNLGTPSTAKKSARTSTKSKSKKNKNRKSVNTDRNTPKSPIVPAKPTDVRNSLTPAVDLSPDAAPPSVPDVTAVSQNVDSNQASENKESQQLVTPSEQQVVVSEEENCPQPAVGAAERTEPASPKTTALTEDVNDASTVSLNAPENKVLKETHSMDILMQQWQKRDSPPKTQPLKSTPVIAAHTETPAKENLKKITADDKIMETSPTSVGALIQQWAKRQ